MSLIKALLSTYPGAGSYIFCELSANTSVVNATVPFNVATTVGTDMSLSAGLVTMSVAGTYVAIGSIGISSGGSTGCMPRLDFSSSSEGVDQISSARPDYSGGYGFGQMINMRTWTSGQVPADVRIQLSGSSGGDTALANSCFMMVLRIG